MENLITPDTEEIDTEEIDTEEIDTNLTTLESLALLRCVIREKVGTDENGADITREVRDLQEIQNFLFVAETIEAESEGLAFTDATARARRVSATLGAAYLSARLKLSITGVRDFDLVLPPLPSPEEKELKAKLRRMREAWKSAPV